MVKDTRNERLINRELIAQEWTNTVMGEFKVNSN
jgi:hypothetical protein